MLTVPPALLNLLDLQAGDTVGIGVDNGRLVIEPVPRPHYTLADLLAQCDASQEVSQEDLEWLNAKPAVLAKLPPVVIGNTIGVPVN